MMSIRRWNSASISSWVMFFISMISSNRNEWPLYRKESVAGSHSYTVFVISSFVSGSNPTSSTICLIRRTIESPILAWVWMITKFRAVRRILGVLIGGVSSPFTIDFTEAAGVVGLVGWPVAMAWNIVYVSLPR